MSAVLPISLDEAAELADEFESRPAEDLLRWTAERFGERAVLTCSWQKQSSVLVHMLSEVAPSLRVSSSTRACSSPRPTTRASG